MAKDEQRGAGAPVISANQLRFVNPKAAATWLMPDRAELPKVTAPSLDGIAVTVPAPAEVTQAELFGRLRQLARPHAKVSNRKKGELVALGDEALIDTLAYSQSKLIPFSAQADLWLEVVPDPALPGFRERLVGQPVGAGLRFELALPASYPAEKWRRQSASFLVDLRSARRVELPALDNPALLKKLERGDTLEKALQSVADDLEKELADRLRLQGVNLVLDALAERARAEPPASLVDEEIRRNWLELERPILARKAFNPQEEKEAIEAWLADPGMREQARRRLAVTLTVKAIVEKEGIEADPKAVEPVLKELAAFGIPERAALAELKRRGEVNPEIAHAVMYQLGVEHIMKRAKVTYATP